MTNKKKNIKSNNIQNNNKFKGQGYVWMAIVVAIVLSLINIVFLFCIENKIILFFVLVALNLLCLIYLYRKYVSPSKIALEKFKKLEEENKQLEQMRSEFVANVSHEIKTPLTSISGFLETLQNGAAEDPKIRERFLDIMSIETARLKRLIEDLLVLSEIESKKEIPDDIIDIKEVVGNIVESIMPISSAKNIEIIQNIEENIQIKGSEDRFRQMLLNLVENGIKYSEEGKKIYISARRKDKKIIFSVKDEGIGIEKKDLENLFQRFYRVDKSRSRKEGGTGLGLSIVKHIVVLFDADIKVESNPGQGTEFIIYFKEMELIDSE